MRKPVRRVRRFLKRKGKGKGKHPGFYLSTLTEPEIEGLFFAKGKGKGKGKRSSGKGKGRRTNPKGPDGQIMKCRKCGSTEHFQRECPRNQGGGRPPLQGTPAGAPQFLTVPVPQDESMQYSPLGALAPMIRDLHGPQIAEIVGDREVPLSSTGGTPRGSQDTREMYARYFMTNEQTYGGATGQQIPDPWQFTSDPWSRSGNTQGTQEPLFSPIALEQYEARVASMSSPMLNLNVRVEPKAPSVSSNDSRPAETRVPAPIGITTPLWATFDNAAGVRGKSDWNPEARQSIHVPALYRTDMDNVEPMHAKIVEAFHARRKGPQKEISGLYRNDDERLDVHQTTMIRRSKELQDTLKKNREEAKAKARRTARAKYIAENAMDAGMNPFDGSVDKCAICLEVFQGGDPVCRLLCRHVFHEVCMNTYSKNARVLTVACPECRGPANDPRNYVYIAENQFVLSESSGDESVRLRAMGTRQTPDSPASSTLAVRPPANQVYLHRREVSASSGSHSWPQLNANETFLPTWTIETPGTQTELCYHGNTCLPDGREGLLIDPGAWSNLAGQSWVHRMCTKALKAGLKVKQARMDKPLNVAGVGHGTNKAEWEVKMPIALGDTDGTVLMHNYTAPTVTGAGSELPALLGLQSMSKQNGVLEMAAGNEYLTLPGPGGYTVTWSPGTARYKLERAPSGHLILPCDEYKKVDRNRAGVDEPMVSFFGTQAAYKKVTREMSTQTDPVEMPIKNPMERNRKHPRGS
jgi:hypothetical protein